jgi:hypothetical protein
MSKIVYLFGAGASFGKRAENDRDEILEGLPIVTEFSTQINKLIVRIQSQDTELKSQHKAKPEEVLKLIDELNWLKESSENHHTVDTFAKKLRVSEGGVTNEYLRLKAAISAFLTLLQLLNKPDSRYDAFFANILGNSYHTLPNGVSILSWNYDCQFEIAHAAYSKRKNLNSIWDDLNISGKTTKSSSDNNIPFSITKLNGTALMYEENHFNSKFFDAFFNRQGMSEINYVSMTHINYSGAENVRNALSFAWEGYDNEFEKKYLSKVIDTEILVIIGYSFPYFNREVDRKIIRNMTNLKKVYIQDPFSEDVKENFEAVLSVEQLEKVENNQIKIVLKKNTKQFVIPNEM